mgnify:CR=1 FL=1
MGRTVDYYLAPQSPWAYLGHQRLADIVQRTGATVRVMPMDLGGKVFPISGGLPLGQRAPQRQAYRLVELQRFSAHLDVPLNLKPRYFPVGGDDPARLIIATDLAHGAFRIEPFENFRERLFWDPGPGILHDDQHAVLALARPNPHRVALFAEGNRIGNQIDEDLRKPFLQAHDDNWVLGEISDKLDLLLLRLLADIFREF